jgi:hypothetical protein
MRRCSEGKLRRMQTLVIRQENSQRAGPCWETGLDAQATEFASERAVKPVPVCESAPSQYNLWLFSAKRKSHENVISQVRNTFHRIAKTLIARTAKNAHQPVVFTGAQRDGAARNTGRRPRRFAHLARPGHCSAAPWRPALRPAMAMIAAYTVIVGTPATTGRAPITRVVGH